MNTNDKIILGIDPGTLVMGYGLIKISKQKISLLEMGVLQLSKYDDHAVRLQLIFKKMEQLIKHYAPTDVAIEAPFFGKNVQSMLKLGRAQGVAIAAAMMHNLEAVEYAPRKIKQVITGKGNASKEQVWSMLQRTLTLDDDIRFMDASDAVGVALCHFYQLKASQLLNHKAIHTKPIKLKKPSTKKSDWSAFLNQNPDRIKK